MTTRGHMDKTSDIAMGRATRDRGRPAQFHAAKRGNMAQSCHVDGGDGVHGRRGFRCPRCVALNQDQEGILLVRLDKLAGGDR